MAPCSNSCGTSAVYILHMHSMRHGTWLQVRIKS
jgi:hypothetical protein